MGQIAPGAKKIRLSLIFLALAVFGAAVARAESPYVTDVVLLNPKELHLIASSPSRDLRAPDRNTITPLRWRTGVARLGSVAFSFSTRRNVNWSASGLSREILPVLLQGKVRVARLGGRANSKPFAVAASIIGNKLSTQFVVERRSRRKRLYTITMLLDGTVSVAARTATLPESALGSLACATSEANEFDGQSLTSPQPFQSPPEVSTQTAPLKEFTISTEADGEWYGKYGDSSNAIIASYVNVADVIYRQQFGVTLKLIRQHLYQGSSPLLATDAGKLLTQFSENRENPVNLGVDPITFYQDVDIRHLFTGKDIDGAVVGIAYLGVACSIPEYATGLTQDVGANSTWAVFIHEMGHNFGAAHDTSDRSSVMYPSVAVPPSDRFSATSIAQINSHLGYFGSRCMTLVEGEVLPREVANPQPELPTPAPTVNPVPSPIPTQPNPSSFDPSLAELSLSARRYTSNGLSIYRLSGVLVDQNGNPGVAESVRLLAAGRPVGTSTTDEFGRYTFFITLRLPPNRRLAVWVEGIDGFIGSPDLMLRSRRRG